MHRGKGASGCPSTPGVRLGHSRWVPKVPERWALLAASFAAGLGMACGFVMLFVIVQVAASSLCFQVRLAVMVAGCNTGVV